MKEKSPISHGISPAAEAGPRVPGQGSDHALSKGLCGVIPGSAERKRKKLFSAWMTDGLGLLFFGFQDTVLLLFPESFHLFFQCWKLMPVRSSETSWQHIYEPIIFHPRLPYTGCYCCREEVPEVTIPCDSNVVGETVLCKVGFEKAFAGWIIGAAIPSCLVCPPRLVSCLSPEPTPDMPEEDRSFL